MVNKVWTYEEIKPEVHWMCLQMGEMTLQQIEMGRVWASHDNGGYSIPVDKNYLFALFDAAEKYLKMRD